MADSLTDGGALVVRSYGSGGPTVLVLHGGPGAAGSMAPVAEGLAQSFRVLEPFQRRAGDTPLTVERHVEDLRQLIESHCPGTAPALVGSSWGAMLALAYAARYPRTVGPIVLIGCGTFDAASRQRLEEAVARRTDDTLRRHIGDLTTRIIDADERLAAIGHALLPVYSYDVDPQDAVIEECDARGHEETWNDMLRLQLEGLYPAAFSAIRSPVLMLHGSEDPHPAALIRKSLAPHLPQLQYVEWEHCGHYPWLEREVREEFRDVLRSWLTRHAGAPSTE